jgi:hypothetical protein
LNGLSGAGAICASEAGVTWTGSGVVTTLVGSGCMAVDKSSEEIPTRLGVRSEVPKSNWASVGWRGGMDGGPLEKTAE